ncbi:hypothetical protein KPL78_19310 [Roseomonas sp. HJA6]|uniref:Uncharacterized protein n=1 Tax=Roseomonas alba TaxID=2846776 RepID=A0ABS7ACI2_9PROT|nr:hypothetical protein [Neoroseomonas alba]MBW6400018.1 hypothetical protein [Neoroseomonas alba]
MPPTLYGAMDAPLTELMRAAVLLGDEPGLRAVQERIVASVQVLEAVRIGIAAREGVALCPPPAAVSPIATVISLDQRRATRAARGGSDGR